MTRSTNTEMPTFFVIGAAKCGSTSLHRYLDLHPEISMSKIKEPMFFLPEDFRAEWTFSPVPRSRQEYLDLFEPGKAIRGESSTAYSSHPTFPRAPGRIHGEVPDAKFIYMVRDPIERARSAWVQRMGARMASNRGGGRLKSFREMALPFEDADNSLIWPGMYMTQIRKFLEFFPDDSILVGDSDELLADREATMAKMFRFVGADPDFTDPGFHERHNPNESKRVESGAYINLSGSKVLRRGLDLLPRTIRERAVEAVRGPLLVPVERPEIDDDLRGMLVDHFRPEVEELREFTGNSFPAWSI